MAHLAKRWSDRAGSINFLSVHLIVYVIVINGRISLISPIARSTRELSEEDNLLIRCYDYTKVSTLQIDFWRFLTNGLNQGQRVWRPCHYTVFREQFWEWHLVFWCKEEFSSVWDFSGDWFFDQWHWPQSGWYGQKGIWINYFDINIWVKFTNLIRQEF